MIKLALGNDDESNWIKLDTWEASDPTYITTDLVLEHHRNRLKNQEAVFYLCGGDFFDSFSRPQCWTQKQVR